MVDSLVRRGLGWWKLAVVALCLAGMLALGGLMVDPASAQRPAPIGDEIQEATVMRTFGGNRGACDYAAGYYQGATDAASGQPSQSIIYQCEHRNDHGWAVWRYRYR